MKLRIGRVSRQHHRTEFHSIKPDQSRIRTNPHKTIARLDNGRDGIGRQTVRRAPHPHRPRRFRQTRISPIRAKPNKHRTGATNTQQIEKRSNQFQSPCYAKSPSRKVQQRARVRQCQRHCITQPAIEPQMYIDEHKFGWNARSAGRLGCDRQTENPI